MLPGPPPSSGSHLSSLALNSHPKKLNFLSARITRVCHQEQPLFYFSKKGNWHFQEEVRYRKVWCSKSTEIALTRKTVHYRHHRVSQSEHCVAQAPFLYRGQPCHMLSGRITVLLGHSEVQTAGRLTATVTLWRQWHKAPADHSPETLEEASCRLPWHAPGAEETLSSMAENTQYEPQGRMIKLRLN